MKIVEETPYRFRIEQEGADAGARDRVRVQVVAAS